MFEKLISLNVSVWPPGRENFPGSGGSGASSVRHAVIWPFLPDANVPAAVTEPETVTLLAALGQFPPPFTQWKVSFEFRINPSQGDAVLADDAPANISRAARAGSPPPKRSSRRPRRAPAGAAFPNRFPWRPPRAANQSPLPAPSSTPGAFADRSRALWLLRAAPRLRAVA